MPYRRTQLIPSEQELVQGFESAIKNLVQRFRNHPYAFYTESDLHCYLYHRLYKPPFNGLYRTQEGHDTILLHKEYPTIARYQRQTDRTLKNDPQGRRRGHFDISVWNPNYINANAHRQQKVLCAAEVALNECGTNSVHTLNDATKLADVDNEIKFGYLLYFVRDEPLYRKNETKIRAELDDAATRVKVVFARVEKGKKPPPEYLGPTGAW